MEGDIYDDKEPPPGTRRRHTGQKEGKRPDSRPDFLEGTVLLETVMRFGRISYEEEYVKVWDHSWQPSEATVRCLSNDWKFRPFANITFVAQANGGISYCVQPQSICVWLRAILLTSILGFLKLGWNYLVCISYFILSILNFFFDWLSKKIDPNPNKHSS